jgi:hypothetical protein
MPLRGFARSSFVSVFPPTTFLNSPPIAPMLDPTSPVDSLEYANDSRFAFCSAIISSISSSRSLSTNSPFAVLRPHVSDLISSSTSVRGVLSLMSPCE